MKNMLTRILPLAVVFMILATACSLPGKATESPRATVEPATTSPFLTTETGSGPASSTGDSVSIVSVSPPVPAGISLIDPVTVLVQYNLTIPEGNLQVWFERFTDANCTILGYASMGGTTMAGTIEAATGGSHEVSITFPPLPLLEVAYVGVGARLWAPDNRTTLVEDMSYHVCYAVKTSPADLAVLPPAATATTGTGASIPTLGPTPGMTARTGAISGIVYLDNNANGLMDAGETGGGPFEITLADVSCSTSLGDTLTDANGNYAFSRLPAGTFCVIITYSSGLISPGYWQRVTVVADNTSPAYFGLQPSTAPPSSPSTGYCGDGVVDTSLGEQCDPPNLTNCTASCQTYTGYCGNGIVDVSLGEQCDPPNITDCTASCQTYVAWCGNGIIDSGETCDPPNVDFCTASCQLYLPNCGNGIINIGEECDPPNVTNCTAQCQNWP